MRIRHVGTAVAAAALVVGAWPATAQDAGGPAGEPAPSFTLDEARDLLAADAEEGFDPFTHGANTVRGQDWSDPRTVLAPRRAPASAGRCPR